jgi:2-polyprenyl-6-hydroxyphenyl methylase/3-demethylubiquinone-9 3-methyltransferase
MERSFSADQSERTVQSRHVQEVQSGRRFEFGKNWKQFLSVLDEGRIVAAEQALQHMLGVERLDGKRFLDIGCGSGVFSLAAIRLGATVHSFDYDPHSIECARMLKTRYADITPWVIEEASVLDRTYLDRLGQFDVVYSWGVLHHTGAMWQALEHVIPLIKSGGVLFIAIYNDQGGVSRRWKVVKQIYNRSPRVVRPFILFPIMLYFEGWEMIKQLLRGHNPVEGWVRSKDPRGMHRWYDWVDWIGGYPFEVAKPEEIFDFYRKRGFVLNRMLTQRGGLGCNEYVFVKNASPF